jgi:hypothetical protein
MHPCYFGNWSDTSNQDATAMMQNMLCKLCVDGCATQLINRLMVGGTVRKRMEGTTTSYHCGKSIYGQGKLLAAMQMNALVEALGHGKGWLNRKMGSNKRYCQQCMCCILMPEMANSGMQMLSAKWIERDCNTVAMSLADKCVHLVSDPAHLNGIKSKGMWAKCKGRALVPCNDYALHHGG